MHQNPRLWATKAGFPTSDIVYKGTGFALRMFTLTNINAMNAAQAVTRSHADVQTSMERLSTGSRINAASDDAAGIGVVARMTSQILELGKAIDNAADGIAMLSTADGALHEIVSMLQRIRELSLQNANGAVTTSDKASIQTEIDALKTEIDRVGLNTQVNGKQLFSATTKDVSVGPGRTVLTGELLGELSFSTLVGVSDYDLAVSDNTNTYNWYPSVAGLTGGGHVVTWETETSLGRQIFAQLFAADGTKSGSEFQVNTSNSAVSPRVAALTGGGFVVAWQGSGSVQYDIEAQIFSADGSKVGSEITVNTHLTGDQYSPSVTSTQDGGFMVAWGGTTGSSGAGTGTDPIRAQKFDASGGKVGSELNVSGNPVSSFNRDQELVELSSGKVVVSWRDYPSGGNKMAILNSDGTAATSVSTIVSGSGNSDAELTALANGNFVATYTRSGATGVYAKIFDESGASAGEITLNSQSDLDIGGVTQLNGGNIAVVYQALGSFGVEIYSQIFDSSGVALGNAFQVNSYSSGQQQAPVIAATSDGGYVVTWFNGTGGGSTVSSKHFNSNGDAISLAGNEFADYRIGGDSSSDALTQTDSALNNLNSKRASIGAQVNSITHLMHSLMSEKLNTSQSRSRVTDVNYATETSDLASAQIKNNSAMAILAQANKDQELTLKLIDDWL